MNTLPPPIVAALETLGSELVTWAQEHRDSTLVDQEQAVLERVRAALPRVLGAVLTQSTRKLQPGWPRLPAPCATCGRRAPRWRRPARAPSPWTPRRGSCSWKPTG